MILPTSGYVQWLDEEEDPRELMRPFSSEAMRMWPISTRVNKPENDDPTILDEIALGPHRDTFCARGWSTSIFLRRRRTILIDKPYPKWQS